MPGDNSGYLIDYLKDFLQAGLAHQRVSCVITCLLKEHGKTISNQSSAWAGSVVDLIDMSITLQRVEETRTSGLNILEELMDLDVYGISNLINDMDRRLPN